MSTADAQHRDAQHGDTRRVETQYDVLGIENPIMDLLVQVPEDFLRGQGLGKNTYRIIDTAQRQTLLAALRGHAIVAEAGGSCANTMVGLAQLGGRAAYCGKAGVDEYGALYIARLEKTGVRSFVSASGSVTGSSIILVTPDASRTMSTHLGACQELAPADIPLSALERSRMLYLTGYLWDTDSQKEAARVALRAAQRAGIPVAFSLADRFCVERSREDFVDLIKGHVQLLFCNRDEALALTGRDNPHQALRDLRRMCPLVALTMSHAGALVAQGDETVYVEAHPVHPVDTTGAGDSFAAGFLFGQISGASLFQSARLGNYFAARVITRMGPRLDGDVKAQLAPVLNDPR